MALSPCHIYIFYSYACKLYTSVCAFRFYLTFSLDSHSLISSHPIKQSPSLFHNNSLINFHQYGSRHLHFIAAPINPHLIGQLAFLFHKHSLINSHLIWQSPSLFPSHPLINSHLMGQFPSSFHRLSLINSHPIGQLPSLFHSLFLINS